MRLAGKRAPTSTSRFCYKDTNRRSVAYLIPGAYRKTLLFISSVPAAKEKTEEKEKKAAAAVKKAIAKKPPTAEKGAAASGAGEAWVHKYAPQSLDDMVGNQTLVSVMCI